MLRPLAGSLLFALIVLSLGCPGPMPTDLDGGNDAGNQTDGGVPTCTPEMIDADAGGKFVSFVSLALDSNGSPHVAYFDAYKTKLRVGVRTASGWNTEAVTDGGNMGSLASIAVDSGGKSHVSYYDITNTAVRYATNTSGAWVSQTVSPGAGSAIALDSTGAPHIALTRNSTPYSLQVATRPGTSWAVLDVDALGQCDQPSFKLDAAGKGHISYLERNTIALKYATDVSGVWVTVPVDVGGVGSASSLALDSAGKVHITYLDSTNLKLKYATNASGSWVATTVDAAGPLGLGKTSLAIDSHDKLHVTYYVGTAEDLGYVTNASGAWVARPLVTGSADFGNASSVAVDSAASTLHAAFSDRTTGAIRYVSCK